MDFKNVAGKAMRLARKNADKLDVVIDKAGDAVDKKTGGKYGGQVDAAQKAAKKAIRSRRRW
ncbi:antitoxin [Nocardia sp. CNY236]|uniref:antitoxin n=1 Tax=Nocardia sp. CNY236 TaxID=1169152 RepID=UPI000426322C|nr:antitoxin [Nocardia sp. CNY236]